MKRYFNWNTFGGWMGVLLSLYLFYFYIDTDFELMLIFGCIVLAIALIWILFGLRSQKDK